MTKVIGYIRVSTIDQDPDKKKADVLKFTRDRGFGDRVEFVTEKISGAKSWRQRKLKEVAESLSEGDILIVPELSRIARSLKDLLDVLDFLSDKGVRVFSVKEQFQINGESFTDKTMRTFLGLFAELERDLIRMRTREGMADARQKGKRIGSPQNMTEEVWEKAHRNRKELANQNQNNRHAAIYIKPRIEKGWTLQAIADGLNREGHKTRNGKKFYPASVKYIYERFKDTEL